ncbi:MAG: hypothetical protein DA407_15925 [Bacteroidetes bacterium]|nr:MAG: hypothetical protein DA407_15925 [Bacteroidota bacterium]
MFFKRLKRKSNQKYMNNILNGRKASVDDRPIKSVGVIFNQEEFKNYDQIRSLFKGIGINENRVKFITFIDDEKSRPNGWDAYFYPENFGWKGKIEGADLVDFVNEPFDALISYYQSDDLELNMITTMSKANFKIGISNKDERLYDFIINMQPNQINIFKNELIKYLKVFNKI